jgi:heptosyltransferase-3
LSELSLAYIGMDTLNMHIAAAQNKRIFAIFGPTNLTMWSPWSNQLQKSATEDKPTQSYGNITIFQANMPCVACGQAGCDNLHGKSECLDHISPKVVFDEVKNWHQNVVF